MKQQVKDYLPLLIIVVLCIAMSMASAAHITFMGTMNAFMGYFFCLLSLFNFFNLPGFVDGFAMYDLLAKKVRAYGFIYPFIELGLGLFYLAQIMPIFTNLFTLLIMTVSAIGVIKSTRAGLDLRCACLGTVLNVPLSTVSIIENLGMAAMAAINLVRIFT